VSGELVLRQEFVIVGGEYDGRHLFRSSVLSSLRNLGYLKRDLRVMGIDTRHQEFRLSHFLQHHLGRLQDRVLRITVRSKVDSNGMVRTRIYLNELVGLSGVSVEV
ncbi:MAG TPA: hypothetical protein VHS28_06765, partial [Chloroflexota bacterium]|nr:hypothetical protein [Chloroflexota bacterium]